MRLTELEPRFERFEEREEEGSFVVGPHETWVERGRPTERRLHMAQYYIRVPTLAEAHGIMFLCPVCFRKNGGKVGTHSVLVNFAGRDYPEHLGVKSSTGKPVRWDVSGTSFDDLTISPSILSGVDPGCHFFVRNGGIDFC